MLYYQYVILLSYEIDKNRKFNKNKGFTKSDKDMSHMTFKIL